MTFSNEEEARKIGNKLLDERAVACIQLFPIKSSYWWNDRIEHAEEIAMIAKTIEENFQKVKEIVKSMHSYETAEIIAFRVDSGDNDYVDWVNKAVS